MSWNKHCFVSQVRFLRERNRQAQVSSGASTQTGMHVCVTRGWVQRHFTVLAMSCAQPGIHRVPYMDRYLFLGLSIFMCPSGAALAVPHFCCGTVGSMTGPAFQSR